MPDPQITSIIYTHCRAVELNVSICTDPAASGKSVYVNLGDRQTLCFPDLTELAAFATMLTEYIAAQSTEQAAA